MLESRRRRRRNEEWEGEALLVLISRNAELGLISGGQTSPARTSGAPFVFQRGGRLSAAAHISQGHVWLFCTSQISASDDILSRGSGKKKIKKCLILGNTLPRSCEGQGGALWRSDGLKAVWGIHHHPGLWSRADKGRQLSWEISLGRWEGATRVAPLTRSRAKE